MADESKWLTRVFEGIVVAVVAAVLIEHFLGGGSPDAAQDGNAPAERGGGHAEITLAPGEGAQGSAITVDGEGFQPGEQVSLYWVAQDGNADLPLRASTADDTGDVRIETSVPCTAAVGENRLYALERGGDHRAEASFSVWDGTATDCDERDQPPAGEPGEEPAESPGEETGEVAGFPAIAATAYWDGSVGIDGSGFQPGENVELRWAWYDYYGGHAVDDSPFLTLQADASGGFSSYDAYLPPIGPEVYSLAVWATGGNSGLGAESTLYAQGYYLSSS